MKPRRVSVIAILGLVFFLGLCEQSWGKVLLPHMHAVKKSDIKDGSQVLDLNGLKTCIAYAEKANSAQAKLEAIQTEKKELSKTIRRLDKESDKMGPINKLKGEERAKKKELVMKAYQLAKDSLKLDKQYNEAKTVYRTESAPYYSNCIAKKYYLSDYESLMH